MQDDRLLELIGATWAVRGEGWVELRRRAEDDARGLLALAAGSMSANQLRELLGFCKADVAGGAPSPTRLPGSFEGAGLREIVGRPTVANAWIGLLWDHQESKAHAAADEMLRDPDVAGIPTSDPALATMLLYLRDRDRRVPVNAIVLRGARELGVAPDYDPRDGLAAYDGFCARTLMWATDLGLAPQEVDAVFAAAAPAVEPVPSAARPLRSSRRITAPSPRRREPEREEHVCANCFQRKPVWQFDAGGDLCVDCR